MIQAKDLKISAKDMRFAGPEPDWTNVEVTRAKVIEAYNWYNYVLDYDQRQQIVADYCESDRAKIEAIDPAQIPSHVAALCRMQLRGYVMDATQEAEFEQSLNRLIELGEKKLKQVRIKKPIVKQLDAALAVIADLDEAIDEFQVNYKSEFDTEAFFAEKKITAESLERVRNHYRPLLAELESAIRGRNPDIKEGYQAVKQKHLKALVEFVGKIVSVPVPEKPKVVRVRKKKPVNPNQIVKKIRYLAEDTGLNLASMNPVKLIGASQAWLYNSKTRFLSHYVAETEAGLSVKGTTIQNFSESKSSSRKIRKPETLSSLMQQTNKTVIQQINLLRVKPTGCTGRVNKFTLILKVIK